MKQREAETTMFIHSFSINIAVGDRTVTISRTFARQRTRSVRDILARYHCSTDLNMCNVNTHVTQHHRAKLRPRSVYKENYASYLLLIVNHVRGVFRITRKLIEQTVVRISLTAIMFSLQRIIFLCFINAGRVKFALNL